MAVLPAVPGLTVTIISPPFNINNPTTLPEIPDPDPIAHTHANPIVGAYQASRTVNTYIRATTNAHFGIRATVGPPLVQMGHLPGRRIPYTKIGFHVTVDGEFAWTATCERPWFKNGEDEWGETVGGLTEGKGRKCTRKGFKFAELKTNDDVPAPAKMKRFADRMRPIGVIEVKVYNESYGREGGDVKTNAKGFMNEHGTVPEKALKGEAKSHGVALDKPEKVSRGKVWRTEMKDGEDYPLAIFRFLYRDEEALKILHLIPRTPSPSLSPSPSRSGSRSSSRSSSASVAEQPAMTRDMAGLTRGQQKMFFDMFKKFSRGNHMGGGARGTKIKKEAGVGGRGRGRKRRKMEAGEVIVIEDSEDEDEQEQEQEQEETNEGEHRVMQGQIEGRREAGESLFGK